MQEIKIVEYDHGYAESVARMWNMSSENWGGYDTQTTAEEIIQEHENGNFLNVFLALDGEEVVGYCSFSEYKEDIGALYIPLLNVRPDYHGKKIGKALVLRAVKRAVELAWPRLDLYTWPGNTKAVPLYKKCGFFWEKRDDSTHLMNFIPTVLNTEALKDYFKTIDWYQDSKRPIEVKPDGEKENDFCHFTYLWEREGKKLRVEFERRGRGIRLIETDDYLISLEVDDRELVFGREYPVRFEVNNKSGRPLEVVIKGMDDQNIRFSMNEKFTVIDREVIGGSFYLGEVKEKQLHWRTHPSVSAEVFINGKKALFKVGIVPRFPASVSLSVPEREVFLNEKNICYLDIENGYDQEAEFEFSLPQNRHIQFPGGKLNIKLKAREKRSLPLEYILNNYHFYQEELPVKIRLNGEEYEYSREITAPFRGRNASFAGETEDEWLVCNGNYMLTLSKHNNALKVKNFRVKDLRTFILYPRFGLPFSQEFSKKKPAEVTFAKEGAEMVMRAVYRPETLRGLEFVSVIKLHADGLVENYYQVTNTTDRETSCEIWISQGIYHGLINAVLPLEDGIVFAEGSDTVEPSCWDLNSLAENWIFCCGDVTRGVSWPRESQVKSHEWYFSVDSNLGRIEPGEKACTEPVYMAIDVYADWSEFRAFALKSTPDEEMGLKDKLDLEINSGNPFICGDFKVRIKGFRKANFCGKIKLTSEKGIFKPVGATFSTEDGLREKELTVKAADTGEALDTLQLQVDFDSLALTRTSTIFKVGEQKVTMELNQEAGQEVYTVDNGPIKIKAAPAFSGGLYSLQYNGYEWLDSSFPSAGPRSWWSPWTGGIVTRVEDLRNTSIQEARRTAEFIRVQDNFGSLWQGIKVRMSIEENKDFKGLELDQYFLLRPGVPLLLNTVEIIQNTGRHFDNKRFLTEVFFRTDEDLKDSHFLQRNREGELIKYKAGRITYDIQSRTPLLYGGLNRGKSLLVYQTGDDPIWGLTNIDIIGVLLSTP